MNKTDTDKVLAEATRWIGKFYRKGESAQCAKFVRSVFRAAGVYVGQAVYPDDAELISGYPLGPSYADSFAGPDVGALVPRCQRQPGDIIMYCDTYGDYPKGTITHVGIYAGSDLIIHRPTSAGAVRQDRYNYMTIAEIRRVSSCPLSAGIIITPSAVSCMTNGSSINALKIKIYRRAGKNSIVINNVFADAVVNISVFMAIQDAGKTSILYMTALTCQYNGQDVKDKVILVDAAGQKALVYMDGKEIALTNMSLFVSYDMAARPEK